MAENLMDYLKGKEPKGFESRPVYSRDGDTLSYYFRNDEAYSERVDDLLTVYKSIATDELVGCKVKGITRLLDRLKSFGLVVEPEGEDVRLNLLFFSAAFERPATVHRYYEELGRFTKDVSVDSEELQAC